MTVKALESIVIEDKNIDQAAKKLDFSFVIPEGSPVFKGHYDGMPVLAGAYQLELCKLFLAEYFQHSIRVKTLNRVRFTGFIGPNDPVQIQLNIDEKNNEFHIAVKIFNNKKKVTSAKMIVANDCKE